MAWSYSGDPSASNLDEVRWWIGDTDTDDQQLADAEVNFAIDTTGNNKRAAAWCARALKAKYSREVNIRAGAAGEFRIDLAGLARAYGELADFLEAGMIAYASPWAASISIEEKEDQRDDSDRVVPFFNRNMFSENSAIDRSVRSWNNYGET